MSPVITTTLSEMRAFPVVSISKKRGLEKPHDTTQKPAVQKEKEKKAALIHLGP